MNLKCKKCFLKFKDKNKFNTHKENCDSNVVITRRKRLLYDSLDSNDKICSDQFQEINEVRPSKLRKISENTSIGLNDKSIKSEINWKSKATNLNTRRVLCESNLDMVHAISNVWKKPTELTSYNLKKSYDEEDKENYPPYIDLRSDLLKKSSLTRKDDDLNRKFGGSLHISNENCVNTVMECVVDIESIPYENVIEDEIEINTNLNEKVYVVNVLESQIIRQVSLNHGNLKSVYNRVQLIDNEDEKVDETTGELIFKKNDETVTKNIDEIVTKKTDEIVVVRTDQIANGKIYEIGIENVDHMIVEKTCDIVAETKDQTVGKYMSKMEKRNDEITTDNSDQIEAGETDEIVVVRTDEMANGKTYEIMTENVDHMIVEKTCDIVAEPKDQTVAKYMSEKEKRNDKITTDNSDQVDAGETDEIVVENTSEVKVADEIIVHNIDISAETTDEIVVEKTNIEVLQIDDSKLYDVVSQKTVNNKLKEIKEQVDHVSTDSESNSKNVIREMTLETSQEKGNKSIYICKLCNLDFVSLFDFRTHKYLHDYENSKIYNNADPDDDDENDNNDEIKVNISDNIVHNISCSSSSSASTTFSWSDYKNSKSASKSKLKQSNFPDPSDIESTTSEKSAEPVLKMNLRDRTKLKSCKEKLVVIKGRNEVSNKRRSEVINTEKNEVANKGRNEVDNKGAKGFICEICNRSINNRGSFVGHMKSHKRNNEIPETSLQSTISSDQIINCNFCGRGDFATSRALLIHKTTSCLKVKHPKEIFGKFGCSICGFVVKSKDALTEHKSNNHANFVLPIVKLDNS